MKGNKIKDLAFEKRIKAQFEEKVINLKHKYKEGNMYSIEFENIQVDIKEVDNLLTISFAGYELCSIDENNNVSYNISQLEKFKAKNEELMENGMTDLIGQLGLPDLEYLKYLEKEKNKELEEGKERKKEETEEKENDKDEEGEIDEEEEDKEKETIAKKYGVKSNQIIHINMKNEKLTEDKTFKELVPYAKDKEDMYVIPDKDNYSWKMIGREKGETEFSDIEEANNQIHGNHPDVTIQRIDGDKINEVKPIKMYDIDGKTAVAVIKNDFGQPELLYCRKQEGEQKYFGMVVPEAAGKNVRQADFKERSFLDSKNSSGLDLSKKADELAKAQELEKRGVPSEKEGIQIEEIQGNSEQNRALRKEQIKEDLYKRMGISDKMKGAMPGYLDYIDKKIDEQAEKILVLMDSNENVNYENAIDITSEDQREPGGRTPDENRRNMED